MNKLNDLQGSNWVNRHMIMCTFNKNTDLVTENHLFCFKANEILEKLRRKTFGKLFKIKRK